MMDMSVNQKLVGLKLDTMKSPFSVAFDITFKCNFKCRHCYNNSGSCIKDELSDTELIEAAKEIAKMQPAGICLCGGEPLLRGEVVFEIIKILSESCGTVNMVSNGWIINEEICRKLKNVGLNSLQISIDGCTEFQHENMRMKVGSLQRAKEAISTISKSGLRAVVSFCPNKLNYTSFSSVANMVYDLGATEIRTMPLILMGRGSEMRELQLSSMEYLEFQQIIQNTKKEYEGKDFKVEWGDPLDHLVRLPNNEKLGFNSFSMEIRADGSLLLSSYLPIVVGNIRRHSIIEYWEAGYKRIWSIPKLLNYVEGIYSTTQFGDFIPQAYSGEDIVIDLIDGEKNYEV